MMDDDRTDPMADQVLDGNAIGGLLAGVFAAEMTTVPGRCAHCGTESAVGAMRAYARAPGIVLRCPACEGVVIRVVETPRGTFVDLRGISVLRFDRR
jgi:hypothetical protein